MGRVASFEGVDELASAGRAILDDPQIDMAVVSGLELQAAAITAVLPDYTKTYEQQANIVSEVIPELVALNSVVKYWAATKAHHNITCSATLGEAFVKPNATPLHFDVYSPDHPIHGPLTLSLRLDTNTASQRLFYAQRFNNMLGFTDGDDEQQLLDDQDIYLNAVKQHGNASMSVVNQRPGDLVIIPNYPNPAMHAVETGYSTTRSLVASYLITHT